MPSLLGNRKLNTSMDTLTTRYIRVAWLPSNRDRMVTWIRSPLLYCCVHVSCIATNSGKASVSIGTALCCKGKAIHNSKLVSLWKRNELVFGIKRVSARQWVLEDSLRSEKSVISKSCSNQSSEIIQRVFSCELLCQQSVIVMCAAVNLHSEKIRYPIRIHVELLVTPPPSRGIRDNIILTHSYIVTNCNGIIPAQRYNVTNWNGTTPTHRHNLINCNGFMPDTISYLNIYII
jgi:hypothetical protein